MIGVVKVLVGLLAAGGVGTAAVMALAPEPSTKTAVVTNLVDGDTIDVDIDGRTERIRLLNIDTPETKDPDQPVQCLGPEASAYLMTLIPVGTTVTLEYDRERTDRYDRTLAAIFTADGTLVNAEVARQGLAAAIVVDGNDRFYPPVAAARDEAAAGGRGLHSADIACTLPGQVGAATTAASELGAPDTTASAELDTAAHKAAAAVALAAALESAFTAEHLDPIWTSIAADEQQRLAALVTTARENAQRTEADKRSAAEAAANSEAEAARAADRDRQAREAREQRAREAREQEARRRQQDTDPSQPKPQSDPAPGNPYPGYTGPRCYGPGGVTWKPC